jgi:hypothetical protein
MEVLTVHGIKSRSCVLVSGRELSFVAESAMQMRFHKLWNPNTSAT